MAKKITLMCNGKKLEITPLNSGLPGVSSEKSLEIHAPGQGYYEISIPTLSANTISAGETVRCITFIKGKNVHQVLQELMIMANNYLLGPIHRDFLQSPNKHEVKGVIHPRWETENKIEFEIKPAGRLLVCGESFTLACMTPERYGVKPEAQIWNLEGLYQRGGGEPFRVKLEFDNQGDLVRKTGFFPAAIAGLTSPFELLIEDGDTFEPFLTLINDKGQIGTGKVNPIMLGGGNLLHWETVEACQGIYHVGVVVTDFDGQSTRVYSPLSVNAVS